MQKIRNVKITMNNNTKISPLISELDSEDPDIQQSAAIHLIEMGDSVVEPMIEALNHNSWRVRYLSAWVLGEIGDTRAVEPLVNALNQDNNTDVKDWVAKALGEIGDERAVEPLIQILDNAQPATRRNAVSALGWLGDERAIPHLINMLNDIISDFSVKKIFIF